MTENALTIKDIDNLPYDQIAGEFGFVNEAEQSAGFSQLCQLAGRGAAQHRPAALHRRRQATPDHHLQDQHADEDTVALGDVPLNGNAPRLFAAH